LSNAEEIFIKQYFIGTGHVRIPAFLQITEQLVRIPAILLLPVWLGMQGVQMAQAVADVLTFIIAVPYSVWIGRRLKKMWLEEEGKNVSLQQHGNCD
jgi:Na+-driven multidrug efflux pump